MVFCCMCWGDATAQAPTGVSKPVGTAQQLPVEESRLSRKPNAQSVLVFYDSIMDRIIAGADEPDRLWLFQQEGEPPKPRWHVQTHVAPSFTEDILFTLRELTDSTVDLVVVCPRGGMNFWYQLSAPCMTEKFITVEDAVSRLAFARINLTEKQFPAIRGMMAKFKKIKIPAFVSPVRMTLDGVGYDFKVKSPEWSYSLRVSNPDLDFPLAVWAESCAEDIWKFLRSSKEFGFQAHPLVAIDKNCLGPEILKSSAATGDLVEVDRLIQLGVDVNSTDFISSETALMSAVSNQQLPMIRKLLSVGANPKQRTEYGRSLFHFLTNLSSSVFYETPEVRDALQKAIKDRIKIADLIMETGLDPDAADSQGETPLMAAVDSEDAELTRWFLHHGSDANRKDKKGKTALDRALEKKNPAIIRAIGRK